MHKKEKNNTPTTDPIILEDRYPAYPATEDIYNKCHEEVNINPADISKLKEQNANGQNNVKDFTEDISGDDLDIPGTELDDNEENTGSEDEENNHYSLVADMHNGLEEDKGE